MSMTKPANSVPWSSSKLDGCSGRAPGLVLPTVDDDQGTEFAGFVIDIENWLGGREKNGGDEHNHADEGISIVVSQTERQDDERSAGDPQKNTEEAPGAGVAAQV